MTYRVIYRLLSILTLSFITTYASAGDVFAENKDGVALDRFDAVSYFTAPAPVLGIRRYVHEFQGTRFYFISSSNKDRFAENPERYAPQFGGYCASGTVNGDKVKSHPRVFRIVDDKLYLFSSGDARKEWLKDSGGNIARANERWLKSSRLVRKD